MDIPVNEEGLFEAVDGDDTVVGHGVLVDGVVDFAYTDGVQEARTIIPVENFVEVWTRFRLDRDLELRAVS